MFDSLKKKLLGALNKFTKNVEEEAVEVKPKEEKEEHEEPKKSEKTQEEKPAKPLVREVKEFLEEELTEIEEEGEEKEEKKEIEKREEEPEKKEHETIEKKKVKEEIEEKEEKQKIGEKEKTEQEEKIEKEEKIETKEEKKGFFAKLKDFIKHKDEIEEIEEEFEKAEEITEKEKVEEKRDAITEKEKVEERIKEEKPKEISRLKEEIKKEKEETESVEPKSVEEEVFEEYITEVERKPVYGVDIEEKKEKIKLREEVEEEKEKEIEEKKKEELEELEEEVSRVEEKKEIEEYERVKEEPLKEKIKEEIEEKPKLEEEEKLEEDEELELEEEKVKLEKPKEEKRGFFRKIADTLTKVTLTEKKFEELFWDIEIVLLENNVAVEVIDKIKRDLREQLVNVPISRGRAQLIIFSALKESISDLFDVGEINLLEEAKKKKPYVISFVGVNGSGKTTTIAKIAYLFQKNGLKPVIAASDTFRAAAIQQLESHANKLGIKLIKHDYGADPAAVAFDAIKYAKQKNMDVVLLDTAGRLHSNVNLMDEMRKIIRVAKPDLNLFIGEAITGNDCVEQAREFNDAVGIDGIILCKADVDDKGGAAISVSYVTKKPILYLGIGQGYDDLKEFDKKIILDSLEL